MTKYLLLLKEFVMNGIGVKIITDRAIGSFFYGLNSTLCMVMKYILRRSWLFLRFLGSIIVSFLRTILNFFWWTHDLVKSYYPFLKLKRFVERLPYPVLCYWTNESEAWSVGPVKDYIAPMINKHTTHNNARLSSGFFFFLNLYLFPAYVWMLAFDVFLLRK